MSWISFLRIPHFRHQLQITTMQAHTIWCITCLTCPSPISLLSAGSGSTRPQSQVGDGQWQNDRSSSPALICPKFSSTSITSQSQESRAMLGTEIFRERVFLLLARPGWDFFQVGYICSYVRMISRFRDTCFPFH